MNPIAISNPPPLPVVSPQPGLSTNQLRYLENVTLCLWRHPLSWPFKNPVDPVALQLPDYYSIISNPMDLGTIRQRLQNKYYQKGRDCVQDIELMFRNCFKYNPRGNDICIMATTLKELFSEKMAYMPKVERVLENTAKQKLTSTESKKRPRETTSQQPIKKAKLEQLSGCQRTQVKKDSDSPLASRKNLQDLAAPPARSKSKKTEALTNTTSQCAVKEKPRLQKKAIVSWAQLESRAAPVNPIKSSKELFEEFRKADMERRQQLEKEKACRKAEEERRNQWEKEKARRRAEEERRQQCEKEKQRFEEFRRVDMGRRVLPERERARRRAQEERRQLPTFNMSLQMETMRDFEMEMFPSSSWK